MSKHKFSEKFEKELKEASFKDCGYANKNEELTKLMKRRSLGNRFPLIL
jgi:hypothetical protein